ncbi:unnamed protein product [Calypogeia fissa]
MVTKMTQIEEGIWEQGDQSRAADMVTTGTQTDQSLLRLEDGNEQLLPGIPDEITLGHVVPKLPWRASYILVSVSRRWQQAVRSGRVYDARIRSSATETLVAIVATPSQYDRRDFQISLYSMSDKCCYQLPPFPVFGRIPRACQCVILDGKIYVLGGEVHNYDSWSEVWVFDLVGQRGWKKCANMHKSRSHFGCAVKDGRIFVFGGGDHSGSEVYDPKENTWFLLAPMLSQRSDHRVAAFGEGLTVYGGYFFSFEPDLSATIDVDDRPTVLEVYDPVADEWRARDALGSEFLESAVFRAQGKFYSVTEDGIDIYDDDEGTWSHRYSNSFPTLEPEDFLEVEPIGGITFNDELILAVEAVEGLACNMLQNISTSCLLQSKGFGSRTKTIVWQQENFSLYFGCSSMASPLIGLLPL